MRGSFVLLLLLAGTEAWKLKSSYSSLNIKKFLCTLALGSVFSSNPVNADDPTSFANQLKLVQSQQVSSQRAAFEDAEKDAINREIKWAEGRLIARGAAILQPVGTNLNDFPLGVKDVSALDPVFSDPDATMFVLGVGREDLTPIAAKKIKLKDLTFPLIFELETADLVFPYTPDAWKASSNSKDSIAVTCILSPGGKLAVPNSLNLIGFAVSDPVNIGGSFQRSTARVFVNGRIDTNLYSKEEVALLSGIDNALDGKTIAKK